VDPTLDEVMERGAVSITCHCTGCGVEFALDDQFAGHKAKCPMCSAEVLVARPAGSRRPPEVASPEDAQSGAATPPAERTDSLQAFQISVQEANVSAPGRRAGYVSRPKVDRNFRLGMIVNP